MTGSKSGDLLKPIHRKRLLPTKHVLILLLESFHHFLIVSQTFFHILRLLCILALNANSAQLSDIFRLDVPKWQIVSLELVHSILELEFFSFADHFLAVLTRTSQLLDVLPQVVRIFNYTLVILFVSAVVLFVGGVFFFWRVDKVLA